MLSKVFKTGFVLSVLVGLASRSASADLVTNGSFETPVVSTNPPTGRILQVNAGSSPAGFGWTVGSGNVEINAQGYLGGTGNLLFNGAAYSGNQWLDLDGVNPGSILETINTTAGQKYSLSFAYANNPFPPANQVSSATVSIKDALSSSSLISPLTISHQSSTGNNYNWTLASPLVFQATSAKTTLSFASNDPTSSAAGIFLDAISVSAVPEPSSLSLAGIASASGLGYWMLKRRKKTALGSILAVCFLCVTSSARADLITGNLLANPGAETGNLTSWTTGANTNPKVDNGTFDPSVKPHTGSFDFLGYSGPSASLSQSTSLVGNQGITASMIDSGTSQALVQFWEQGYDQGSPSDNGFITLNFRNASNSVLSSISTPVVDSHAKSWGTFSGVYAIPVGTRSINYTMNFTRNQGTDLDTFFDDNSLVFKYVSAVPEPTSFALFGVACGLLGVLHYRKQRRRGIVA